MHEFEFFLLTLFSLIPTIIILVAVWRGMKAHESIANSLSQMAHKNQVNKILPEQHQQSTNPTDKHENDSSTLSEEHSAIVSIKPELASCLKEAELFLTTDPARAKDLMQWYRKKSSNWLINQVINPKGFQAAYGLMVVELYQRNIDLSSLTIVKSPDELPKR